MVELETNLKLHFDEAGIGTTIITISDHSRRNTSFRPRKYIPY